MRVLRSYFVVLCFTLTNRNLQSGSIILILCISSATGSHTQNPLCLHLFALAFSPSGVDLRRKTVCFGDHWLAAAVEIPSRAHKRVRGGKCSASRFTNCQ